MPYRTYFLAITVKKHDRVESLTAIFINNDTLLQNAAIDHTQNVC